MPRSARIRIPGLPLHIVHRGHNRMRCFFRDRHFRRYLEVLEESAARYSCDVHAFVLMPNHVHLLVSPAEPCAISWFMKRVAQDHAQHINRTCGRTGALWEGRYYASYVDCDTYLLRCYRYIELNPVRAGMVNHPAEYPWSSFRANALGYPVAFLREHPVYLSMDATPERRMRAYRTLFDIPLTENEIELIRGATRSCRAIGSASFVERLEKELGRPIALTGRGKPKTAAAQLAVPA